MTEFEKILNARHILRTKVSAELEHFEKMKYSPVGKRAISRMEDYLGFLQSVLDELAASPSPDYYPLENIVADMEHANRFRAKFYLELDKEEA